MSQSKEPFIWGVNDCCHFAGNWLLISTGKDFIKQYSCDNVRDALTIIKQHNDVDGIADKHLERIHINMAKRGDIVMCLVDGKRKGLGICEGLTSVFKSKDGLVRTQTINCDTAWGAN